jgi:sulfotransferase
MKNLFFLSGLPRSGSSVLSAILNQNPNIFCSKTSPLPNMMSHLIHGIAKVEQSILNGEVDVEKESLEGSLEDVLSAVANGFYKHKKQEHIIDKSRDWVVYLDMIKKFNPNPKILFTTRNVADIINSYMNVSKVAHYDAFNVIDRGNLRFLNEDKSIIENNKDVFHFVDYDRLIDDPKNELEKIYKFLDIEPFEHQFDNIDTNYTTQENEVYPGLHDVRKVLKRRKINQCLTEEQIEYYNSYNVF